MMDYFKLTHYHIFEGGQGAEERWFENAVAFGIGYGVLTQGFTGNKA